MGKLTRPGSVALPCPVGDPSEIPERPMQVSDYVACFLASKGVRHVFVVSGGASLHLIHSVADTPGISFVCTQHEQGAVMAADAYARATGRIGAAISTSGPGATNMVTGACGAFYDSVPILLITGQVATFRQKGALGVRQVGFQETDTVEMYRPITKYAVRLDQPERIRFELERAYHAATSGRPGPALVDVPDDLQRARVVPGELAPFVPCPAPPLPADEPSAWLGPCLEFLRRAERPVLILGAGVHRSGAAKTALQLVERLRFPVAPTWAAADLLPRDHPDLAGTFGTHGTRAANFCVQNADLVLSIGSRLDTKATGSPPSSFARAAKIIMVDIDQAELNKFTGLGVPIDLPVCRDAGAFINDLLGDLGDATLPDLSNWRRMVASWKKRYPTCLDTYLEEPGINPYVFVKELARLCREGERLFLDTGCTLAWTLQGFEFKSGQRLFHDWNNTAMGWSLPAAIGGAFATRADRIVCVTGDGSLQMTVQELATVAGYNLPIKVFVIANNGYAMIRQTQDQWLGGRHLASCREGGLPVPDLAGVAAAYGFQVACVAKHGELVAALRSTLDAPGPALCTVQVDPAHQVLPQVLFGRPNEDQEPLLPREEFLANMLVTPSDASLE